MFKHLRKLLLLAALFVPWATQAQSSTCAISSLPFVEDFESLPTGSSSSLLFGTSCWTKVSDATSYYYPYISSSSTYNHTSGGTKGIYWYSSSSTASYGTYQCIVLPRIDTETFDMSDLAFHFWARASAATYSPTFVVGVMSDSSDISTFDTVAVINLTGGINWKMYGTTFEDYTGTGSFIAIRANYVGSYWYAYLDDFIVTEGWCEMPQNVGYSAGENEITLYWEPNGGTSFTVFLGDDTVTNVTDTFYTFPNLTANTYYSAGVANECTDGLSFYSLLNPKTECGMLTALPYVMDFEDQPTNTTASQLNVDCWHYLCNGSSFYPYLSGTTSYNYTPGGTKALYWYRYTSASYGDYQCVVMPPIDTTVFDISNINLHFYAKPTSTSYSPVLYLGVMTDPNNINTFVYVDTINISGGEWVQYGGDCSNYTGDGIYVALRANTGGSSWSAYVDDFVMTDGWCEPPLNPDYTADTNAITLFWESNGSSSFTVYLGTDTIYNVTDTFYTFTGLTPNTPYEYGVSSYCSQMQMFSIFVLGVARTACVPIAELPWTEDFETSPYGSTNDAAFIPCWVRLTDATQYPYAYISSVNHTPDGSRGIYWYRSSSTGTYGTYNCFVLPLFDTETYPINTVQVKFWARATSSSYEPKYVVGIMSDPSDITTFDTIATVEVDDVEWKEYVVPFNEYDGDGEYIAVSSVYTGTYWYANMDDFTIEEIPNCPPIINLGVSVSTASAAIATWEYQAGVADPNEYIVEYGPLDGSESPTTETVTDPNITMLGLTFGTQYYIKVQASCDDGDGAFDSTTFSTKNFACVALEEESVVNDTIGSGTSTDYYFPTYSCYNYSLTQQVYTAAELGTSMTILSLALMPSSVVDANRVTEIYLAHTTQSSLSSFIHPADMVKVYEGTTNYVEDQWYTFTLDQPFSYDTSLGNLLVCFRDMTGVYYCSNYFYVHSNTNGNSYYVYRDDGPYNPYSQTSGYTSTYRNNIIINGGECEEYASCTAPGVTTTFVGSDSVVLSWIPGYDETEWNVDYKLTADTVWTNVATGITDLSYELTGISPNSEYEVRVYHECEDTIYAGTTTFKTECGLLTAFPFVEDFESQATSSSSSTKIIPCWFKTSDATSYFYPYVSASTTYNHTAGGNKGLYWYATTTASYGTYNILVLPGVNTDVMPIDKMRLTFWAKSSSTSYQPTFIVGAMSDPEDESTFVGCDTISPGFITTSWTKVVTRFDNFTADTCNYIAIRQNASSSWTAYVDDITLDEIPPCENVEDVEVVASATSAIVSWNSYGSYQGAYVEWREATDNTWNNTTVYGQNYVVLNNLDMNMPYTVKVTAICGEDTLSGDVYVSFNTKSTACVLYSDSLSYNDTIGNGTNTSAYFPSYGYYNYALSQQIYTASEINGAGKISGISLKPSTFYSTNVRTLEIYLGHTSQSSLTSFIHPSDMVKVYEGSPVMTTGQWYTIDLDTTFSYNGSDNLLVCFRDMTGVYITSYNYFYGHTNPNGNSVYIYQDSGPYDPFSATGGYTSTFRNNMIFTMSPCDSTGVCTAPAAIVTDVTDNTVDVIWTKGYEETSWNLYYRLDGDDTWTTAATGVTDSSYQFTSLQSGMPYEFMVEAVCDQNYSILLRATTLCASINQLPYTEDFNNWGTGSGVLPNCWSRSGTYSTYTYISPSYNHSGVGGGSIYTYAYGSNYSTLILPALDTSVYKVNETELVFYAYAYSTYTGQYIVGVCDDNQDFSTFTPVDTVALTVESGTWQPIVVPLTNYTDSGTYIALRTTPTSTYFYNYIDDLTLELTPACPRVDTLTSSNATTTSVDLGWNDYSNSTTQWQIEYGPFGFEQGTGTLLTATSNPFTLSNPTCNSGVFYVRPICSNGDTGYWSLVNGTFYLVQTPATVPYYYDFETATEWNNWQGSYNVLDHVWVRGTAVADSGSYSMYLSTDQGVTYVPYYNTPITNSATFRDFDFGTVDTSAELTIRARAGGSTTGNYDGLMIFLADPTVTPVASNATLTTPWGHLNNLDILAFIRTDTTWQTYQIPIDNVSGVQRVVFFWFNQNTNLSYSPIYEPAAVDNIHIDFATCVRPTTFTTLNTTSHTATVAWNGPANLGYQVVYRPATGTAADNQFTTTNTNQVTLTGLDSLTTYSMWVSKVCGAGDTSLWSDRHQFTTMLCENGAMAENFDGSLSSTTTSYGPIGYSYYNYSYVQTIVDSAYMATMGDAAVEYFGFNPTTVTTGSSYYTNMNIYLANVPESDLSSGWILPDDSIHVFEKVLNNGTLNFTETGWQVFQLDTSFVWDGHSNVLVSVVRNHGSYSSGPSFSAHSTASKMRYAYRDSGPYNYTNPDVAGTLTAYTGDIRFFSCSAGPSCAIPEGVYASNVTYNSATINWIGTASSYEVQYKAGTDAGWSTAIETTENSYQLTGLVDSTAYLYQLRSICVDEESGDTTYSDWLIGSFTTLHLPCFAPSALEAQTVTYSTATLNWEENGVATQWNVHVWNTQFDSIYSSTSHTFVVSGLTQTTIYNVAVSAQCNEETESEYSDTITIQTLTCQQPTGLTVTDKSATSVTIVWGGSGIGFDVEYGDEHFSEGVNTQVVHVTGNTYTITGLEPEYDYSVSVRAECEEGVYSAYCAQVDFTTPAQGEGIENAGTANVTIYPNPTSNATTIAISGVNGEVEITLVDLSGRVVMTDSMSCTGDCAKKLEVSGLSQGAYFVRLSGENVNMVKKLIVK